MNNELKIRQKKVSLNIKIDREIDERLKRARSVAREQDLIFNVSEHTEKFLLELLIDIETELGITEKTDLNR